MQQAQSESTGGTASELRSDAQQVTSSAANRLHSEVDNRKGAAVTQAKSVSSAIERAAGELDDAAPTWLKSVFQQGAQQIQRFADAIDQKDSRELMAEAQNFARNNPGTFLAACAAAGFAAARVFKAGGEQQSGQRFSQEAEWDRTGEFDQSQPWGSGEQDQFGQDELMDDTFGQGQQSGYGTTSTGATESFIARPETQSPTSEQFESANADPLTLGTGGDGGARISAQGDDR